MTTTDEQLLMFMARGHLLGFVPSDSIGVHVADLSTVVDPYGDVFIYL